MDTESNNSTTEKSSIISDLNKAMNSPGGTALEVIIATQIAVAMTYSTELSIPMVDAIALELAVLKGAEVASDIYSDWTSINSWRAKCSIT